MGGGVTVHYSVGIVFLPDQPKRLTRTNESVGPHDYMPPWADVGGRLGDVHPNFDVYGISPSFDRLAGHLDAMARRIP